MTHDNSRAVHSEAGDDLAAHRARITEAIRAATYNPAIKAEATWLAAYLVERGARMDGDA